MLFLPDYFAHDKVIFGKLNFSSLFDPTGGKKKVKRLKVGPTYYLQNWWRGNLLKRVQCKKIYEILKYCCCATKNEFNNTAWAQGFKKYLRASLFLHNLRVLVTFMIMSRRNVLLFFWHCFWKHNEILCFPVLKH